MRRRAAGAACATALAAALGLAGCQDETGYVEVKVTPGFIVPPLMLGSSKIDTARTGSTVLRQRVGPASLAFERDGHPVSFCEFDVRKNRIVTIAVSAIGRDPRCKVQG